MTNPTLVYIDTNIVYGYAKKLARDLKDESNLIRRSYKKLRKTEIKTDNILDRLRNLNYSFITSYLTNFELIDRLKKEDNVNSEQAQKILNKIIDEYKIIYCSEKSINIGPNFINEILRYDLRLRDALHIEFAKKPSKDQKLNLVILTGDKEMHKAKKIYPYIENPNDLIKKFTPHENR